jgi:hypothetical protein
VNLSLIVMHIFCRMLIETKSHLRCEISFQIFLICTSHCSYNFSQGCKGYLHVHYVLELKIRKSDKGKSRDHVDCPYSMVLFWLFI